MGRYTTGGVGRDVLAGAIAGGAAVWLINKMEWSLTHSGRSSATSNGTDPAHAAAAKAADAAGVAITDSQRHAAGHAVHYGVGVGIGAFYGLLRGMAPAVTTGRGSLFGVATFILGDEVGAPAMGLAKGPLDYPARDHAKSALAHMVFGFLTDLSTRLLSPWKGEVVIVNGPTIQERIEGGRQALSDGRDYLYDQGRLYAEQARDQVDGYDLPGLADKGRKKARKLAEQLRSRLPDSDDLMDVVDEGRQRARSLVDRLPGRGDVEDAVAERRKRARKLAKRARGRLPDRDDVDDAVADGRKRVRRLAEDARDTGGSALDKLSRWLFG